MALPVNIMTEGWKHLSLFVRCMSDEENFENVDKQLDEGIKRAEEKLV